MISDIILYGTAEEQSRWLSWKPRYPRETPGENQKVLSQEHDTSFSVTQLQLSQAWTAPQPEDGLSKAPHQ